MHFPYGAIITNPPPDYTPPEMWPEYGHVADPVAICKREVVQENPVAIRWSLWPLTFELYWGDTTPNVAAGSVGALAYNRVVLWRRLHDGPTPQGWYRGNGIFRIDGYQTLDNDFTARWNKNARRDLRIWQEQFQHKGYTIEEITQHEFADAYKQSLISKRENDDRLHDLERKLTHPLTRVHSILYGIRNSGGKVVAGTAVIYSPTYKSSTHFAPFILEEARHIFGATALTYHWFEQSRAKGCTTVMTTNFWHKGKPKGWKGFSEFKSHFGWEYVTYPPVLWRFVRGKFW